MGSNICDSDKHFELNIVTGALVSNMQKVSLIRGSHNSERFSFDFPRYIECQDLTQCNKVEVHFINTGIGTNKGARPIDDVRVVEGENDKITFSWLIDGKCTEYAGSLSFVIHFKIEEDGKLKYKYPTGIFKGITINDGIDNGEAIIEDYNDIIAEWMAEIEANIDNVVQDAVQSVVEENIGEAVEEAVNSIVEPKVDAAIEAALQDSAIYPENYANAITGYASGTSLQIDDLSPLASKVKVNVVGKQPPEAPAALMMMRSATPAATGDELVNLIPFTRDDGELGYKDAKVEEDKTQGDITYHVNGDGSITVSGVASGLSQFTLYQSYENLAPFEFSKRYTINAVPEGISFGFSIYDSDKNESEVNGTVAVWAKGCVIRLTVAKGTDLTNGVTVYPMIVEGEDGAITGYVPPQGATPDGGDHTHGDANKDHFCDKCGELLSACVDNNNDHICDYCGEVMPNAPHVDSDLDHDCDKCGAEMSEHEDANLDHLCDYCGKKISECVDNNKDNICDVCGKPMEGATGNELVNLIPFTRDDGELGYKDAAVGERVTTSVGVTYLVNADGSITVSGSEASASSVFELYDNTEDCGHFVAGNYYTVFQHKVSGVCMMIYSYDERGVSKNIYNGNTARTASFMLGGDAKGVRIYLWNSIGTDLSRGVTFYPMVVEGKNENITEYVPPIGAEGGESGGGESGGGESGGGESGGGGETPSDPTTVTITTASADDPDTIIETIKTTPGKTIELTPIFPAMIITTDSDEVLLSAEYNKDTNAVIAELREAIGEGGGGADGYTPQKGVDYWTEEDKEEIKSYVDDAILGGAW